ncbi:S-layer homology domain-containing protein [Paenibacillus sp. HB172176]|uniref:S-layer homology domain-containing protein n=1 Tax=Paenibacillus sp. HB172176 TaxID=2493690 RepID=UPI0014389865|nr:S-layer homology domain-containing protein [Paenibacillus sp. HB172176]
MKKSLSLMLIIALLITLLPSYIKPDTASAAGSYFLFPNENDSRANARIVSTSSVALTGTINGVVGSSISYNVKQVTSSGTEQVLNTTEEITTGIATSGDNTINISSLALFPGMNKITFKGVAGTSTVTESIYIEFRDSPMLYDLKITFENKDFDMLEDQPTMLYSTATNVQSQGQMVITGRAPNATKVNIDINGRSYDFNVSTASNNNRFSTSQLSIDKGLNTIKFKVYNGGQIVETTRQVAFYNGEVTYYNMKIRNNATPVQSADLVQNMDFSTSTDTGLQIDGTAILPLPLSDLSVDPVVPVDLTDSAAINTALAAMMKMQQGTTGTEISPDSITHTPAVIDSSTKFITVNFTFSLPNTLDFDTKYNFRFKAPNLTQWDWSSSNYFTLRDSSKAFIQDINYLSGFDGTMTTTLSTYRTKANDASRILSLQSTDIPAGGVDVYSVPMGVEVLIGNYESITGANLGTLVNLAEKIIIGTSPSSALIEYRMVMEPSATDITGAPLAQVVTRTVNNEQQSFLRVFMEIRKLPKSGTNNITFKLNHGSASTETKTVIARLLYGPYVKFDKIVDGMDVKFDTVAGSNATLLTALGDMKGQLYNIVNDDEIKYAVPNQSVFLYINNVEIPLEQGSDKAMFRPAGIASNDPDVVTATVNKIANVLNKAGDNTIKFVFSTVSNSYEYTLKFSIVPTNLPLVPAPNTDGVYPYSAGQWPPVANDAGFDKQGTVYTTTEAEFNVHGTFDFIDLGGKGDVQNKLNSLGTSKPNYIVTIDSPNWETPVEWDLSKKFKLTDKNRSILKIGDIATNADVEFNGGSEPTGQANVTFYYDVDDQSFLFDITNEVMPEDGSALVYVITVFNAGSAGPRATYRMEINPISIPYTIKSPLVEERVTNKNFVEVIITSPGADKIVVNKEQAEKVTFVDHGGDGDTYSEAFRAVVMDLKANKETKIKFDITRGDDTISQELIVKYVPTNIPGAEMMETMSSKHKLFNGALELNFEKNTQLIRPAYNDQNGYATQVYNENDLLFAIANPNDGIVDRHLYESQPPNYSANSQAEGNLHIGYRFQDQARQFIKASPLFWIDGGLADNPDPSSPSYDPITTGLDPFPFPNLLNKYDGTFASRWNQYDRELIPSEPGELTIAYDPSVVQSAGTTITVFRFDPYDSTWENIGGVVDEKKHTVTVPFTKFGYYVATKLTRGFNDITDHPYAREAMEAIFAKGIMNAIDPVGLFGGDRYVTRGEFTRMIVRALDLPLNFEGDLHFSYYPETITNANNASAIYDYRYIETAARAGIVNGKRPGFFDEDQELKRQEAATILARALQLKLETNADKAKKSLDKIFTDSGKFDFYSIPYVLAVQKKGFIQGSLINASNPKEGSAFEPQSKMLRSDAAIIMARVMNDMKKLPAIYN